MGLIANLTGLGGGLIAILRPEGPRCAICGGRVSESDYRFGGEQVHYECVAFRRSGP